MFAKYIIQYAKKRKKNAEKISNCHFETIGYTLYSKDKTRRRALFVESAYINVTNSLDKIKKAIFHFPKFKE